MTEETINLCCPICGATKFNSEKGVTIHIGRMHPEAKATKPGVKLARVKPVVAEIPVEAPEPVSEPVSSGAPTLKPVLEELDYNEVEGAFGGEPDPAPEPEKDLAPVIPIRSATPGISSVPKGARIMLSGTVYKQNPNPPYAWGAVVVQGIVATVGLRQAEANGATWLFLRYDDTVFGIAEADVLGGKFEIVSLPKVDHTQEPPPRKIEVEESPEDKARREVMPKFQEALDVYYTADAGVKSAKQVFDKARKTHYDFLCEVTKAYGSETDKGKGDFRIRDFGYSSHMIRVPGQDRIEYNTDAIINWCLQTGNVACLKQTLDVEAWTNLKKSGSVPDSVIQLYENLIPGQDAFRLQIKKESTEEE